ncbi:alpha/beta hydrolase [Streptomyces sp. APSN-46.1]|uniref:alpha/beta fold hydrolase n=1 Tax=Streptomyces sp. APSN-46.1 TaxID=2929049 RepID=UPI001FB50624|nr:alpha/beta hydrolase [Streptomyces sp. APSN-46.1]MCJ1677855.1 alpha/beta hydrolase [Streptomyces sp. APSN-46.1]
MPRARLNGVELFYEVHGAGDPLVLVHGSWSDHLGWQGVLPRLARSFEVLVYDRRGHSRSERPPGQGSRTEDEDDLAAIIEMLGAPAHVAGNSFGASTALGLAARRPELLRTLTAHEPPLMGIVADDPELRPLMRATQGSIEGVLASLRAGDERAGARRFVEEVAFGPGAWDALPEPIRQTFAANAPTFADEQADPGWNTVDLDRLSSHYTGPALLTTGTESPPWFPVIIDRLSAALPQARVRTLDGAGHVPHLTHPDRYAENLTGFIASAAS